MDHDRITELERKRGALRAKLRELALQLNKLRVTRHRKAACNGSEAEFSDLITSIGNVVDERDAVKAAIRTITRELDAARKTIRRGKSIPKIEQEAALDRFFRDYL